MLIGHVPLFSLNRESEIIKQIGTSIVYCCNYGISVLKENSLELFTPSFECDLLPQGYVISKHPLRNFV